MKFTSLIFFLAIAGTLFSQTQIEFNNPSFEDTPRPNKAPKGWYNCGQAGESPPDIQPNAQFKIEKEPNEGETYLGMVVRDNATWEAVGQKLKTPLMADTTYAFGIHLARSQYYVSLSRVTSQEVNYTTKCVLVISGGNSYCDRKEILYETQPIKSADWELYNIAFTPKEDYEFITFEIYYVASSPFAYNGNLLLDNIVSDFSLLELDSTTLAYQSTKSQLEKVEIDPSNAERYSKSLKNNQKRNLTTKIKATPINKEELSEFPTLQNDLASLKNILEFNDFLVRNTDKQCFNKRPIEEIELLAKDFKDFGCKRTASKIEKLIPHVKAIYAAETSPPSRKNIAAYKKSNDAIKSGLKYDLFLEKLNIYLEKNKKELQLLYENKQ